VTDKGRTHSPHPEEPRSGVSKDASGSSRDIWTILQDAPAALLRMRAAEMDVIR
jgi:hypothetical protein